jgi:nonribosomal peptide synthetase DhbF
MSLDNTISLPNTAHPVVSSQEISERFLTVTHSDLQLSRYASEVGHLLHGGFWQQAQQQPDQVALIHGQESITYQELLHQALAIAATLREAGVQAEQTVGVCHRHPLQMTAGILGVLFAGGAYIPLDLQYPVERLQGMLSDADTRYILASSSDAGLFSTQQHTLIDLDRAISNNEPYNQRASIDPQQLAYVIFTSGSTGRPKGVMIEHGMAVNTIRDINSRYQVTAHDRCLAVSAFSFDLSVYDLFGILAVGGIVVFPTTEQRRDPTQWLKLIAQHRITLWNSVPALFDMLTTWAAATGQAAIAQLLSLRLVMLSGDWIPVHLPTRWWQLNPLTEIHSLGGATEGSIWSICYPINAVDPTWKSIPYGRALTNQQMYVLNSELQQLPVGEVGEICIAGAGVARGYIGQPELTAERFVADPYRQQPDTKLYRTGDLGRFLPDGNIEFLGRVDQQVKLNGYRIELGEIEAVLRQVPEISEALVVLRQQQGKPSLIAYIQVANRITGESVRLHLKQHLPDFMLPTALIEVSLWPLTSNGKVDRAVLPDPDLTNNLFQQVERVSSEVQHVSSNETGLSSETTSQLQQIWSNVLQLTTAPSTTHTFLQQGGDSLRAVELILRVNRDFQVALSPIWPLTSTATWPALAQQIASLRQQPIPEADVPLPRADRSQYVPLSFPQQQLWLSDQLAGDSPVYNVPFLLKIRGQLDSDILQQALTRIVARHENLRSTFHPGSNYDQVQKIHPHVTVSIRVHDLCDLQQRAEATAHEIIAADARRRFDLSRLPLLRVHLFRIASGTSWLYLNVHHLIVDGWTLGLFGQALTQEYSQLQEGNVVTQSPLIRDYPDYALWQRDIAHFDQRRDLSKYWRTQLAGAEFLELPTDAPRPEFANYQGATYYFDLPQTLGLRLQALAREQGVSLFSLFLASWQILLARHSGQTDFCIGTPSSGRNHADYHDLWGYLIQVIAIRNKLRPELSFVDYLQEVSRTITSALEHQDYPLVSIIKDTQVPRLPKKHPLFPVMLVLEEDPANYWQFANCDVQPLPCDNGTSKFEMLLALMTTQRGIRASWEYRADLFSETRIQQFSRQWINLLQAIVSLPTSKLSQLDIVDHRILQTESIFGSISNYSTKPVNVYEYFARQATLNPTAVAVIHRQQEWTYRDLQLAANQVATLLLQKQIQPGDYVGLVAERRFETLAGLLGILQAGAAYLPFDLQLPDDRLKFIVDVAQPKLVLGEIDPVRLTDYDLEVWPLKTVIQSTSVQIQQAVTVAVDSPAYVLFTSGSTGTPKGVVMPHRALSNLIDWQITSSSCGSQSKTLQYAALGFDVSFQELFATWATGGAVVLIDEALRADFPGLLKLINEQAIQRLFLPFIALQQLCEAAQQRRQYPQSLGEVITAGEQLKTTSAIQQFFRQLPNCRMWNHYGPTECHVVTAYQLPARVDDWAALPAIGKPIANSIAVVLDQWQGIAPQGVTGELYLGGECVANGYLGQPELTAERFVELPHPEFQGQRFYRTGDFCRWNWQGELEFVGRRDDQCKIRGYRVELGEIEVALRTIPELKDVAVTARQDRGDHAYLVAYLVWQSAAEMLDNHALRQILETKLPRYLIPSIFINLTELPLNSNGKVNRPALPAPDFLQPAAQPEQIRNYNESRMVRIWKNVFHRQLIHPLSNFFDLGGESLLAARLFQLIEKEFQLTLSLSELLYRPTPRELIELIDSRLPSANSDSLVTLQERGELAPLFMFPGIGGSLVDFYSLARQLGVERPVFGLQPQGLDGKDVPLASVADIAAAYLQEIRSVQQHGPYFLAGYSLGGVIAYEIAQQLLHAGEQVAFLALLDSSFYEQTVEPPVWKRIAFHLRYLFSGSAEKSWGYIQRRLKNFLFWMRHGFRGKSADYLLDSLELSPASRRVAQVHYEAWINYQPQSYSGSVHVLLASWKQGASPEQWSWAHLIEQELHLDAIPSTHDNLFKGKNTQIIAEKLLTMLRRVQTRLDYENMISSRQS